jgi:uncharacterized protein YxeA
MKKTLRNLIFVLFSIVIGSFTTMRALGDDVPTFSEPEVNAFVKAYAELADETIAAFKASQAGDSSKLKAVESKGDELAGQVQQLMGKLKPDETERFSEFIQKIAQKLEAATQGTSGN